MYLLYMLIYNLTKFLPLLHYELSCPLVYFCMRDINVGGGGVIGERDLSCACVRAADNKGSENICPLIFV